MCASSGRAECGARADQSGGDVKATRSAWGEDGGPLIYSHTLTGKNGRSVTGLGFTPEGAEEDAMQAWMRGEG